MRLDKYLCELNIGSRSQVKDYIRQGLITVNDTVATKPDIQIKEECDSVTFRGQLLSYSKFQYFMLNKPEGVVSATQDNTATTVLDLLGPKRPKGLFPVGRLDKDTTGLLIITNDGELAHTMLSPKKHVNKTYLVEIEKPLTSASQQALENGVDIGEERLTAPAKVEVLNEREIYLTIHEGKFHQVKRMLQAVDNRVLHLKRVRFGGLTLDESLLPGESRVLTAQEVTLIHEKSNHA